MDTQMEKKILVPISQESIMLAKKARKEKIETGQITVKCPKCQKIPEITMSSRGERTTISCSCGYIFNEEINL